MLRNNKNGQRHAVPNNDADESSSFYSTFGVNGIRATYVLVDHRDPEVVRYVGSTIDPDQRLAQHIEEAVGQRSSKNPGKDAWIRSLLRGGRKPEMRIVAVGDWIDDGSRELFWIDEHRSARLFNRL